MVVLFAEGARRLEPTPWETIPCTMEELKLRKLIIQRDDDFRGAPDLRGGGNLISPTAHGYTPWRSRSVELENDYFFNCNLKQTHILKRNRTNSFHVNGLEERGSS